MNGSPATAWVRPAGGVVGAVLAIARATQRATVMIARPMFDTHPRHRAADVTIPGGNTVLEEGDRLTLVGVPGGIQALKRQYDVS